MKEQITIHTMTALTGASIKYARIFRKNGQIIIGQSVLLHRLSPDQRQHALDVSDNAVGKEAQP